MSKDIRDQLGSVFCLIVTCQILITTMWDTSGQLSRTTLVFHIFKRSTIYIKIAYIAMYADDTMLYVSVENTKELNKMLVDELMTVSKWVFKYGLKLNISNNRSLIFGSRLAQRTDQGLCHVFARGSY